MQENNIKIRPQITAMEVDDYIIFPGEKMKSVRTITSELGFILKRRYTTSINREDHTITVKRVL